MSGTVVPAQRPEARGKGTLGALGDAGRTPSPGTLGDRGVRGPRGAPSPDTGDGDWASLFSGPCPRCGFWLFSVVVHSGYYFVLRVEIRCVISEFVPRVQAPQ